MKFMIAHSDICVEAASVFCEYPNDRFCIWFVLRNHLLFQYLNVWDLVK